MSIKQDCPGYRGDFTTLWFGLTLTVKHVECIPGQLICDVMGYFLVTTRKQSLGQGNIFKGICQELCSQGGAWSWGVCSWSQ